jgi:hypothetical protein
VPTWVLWLVAGCRDPETGGPPGSSDPPPVDTTPPPHTDTTASDPTDGLAVSCTAKPENVLRYACEVHVDPAQGVEITWVDDAGTLPVRSARSEDPAKNHELVVNFVPPDTLVRWTVTGLSDPSYTEEGSFVTGPVPDGADIVLTSLSGHTSAPQIGMVSPCVDGAVVAIVDPELGRPLWYQDLPTSAGPIGFVDGVSFTEDHTVLAIVNGTIVETDLVGHVLRTLTPGLDLTGWAHHDVFRKNGLTYALFQEAITLPTGNYLLDGFDVFDAANERVAEWHLADVFVPPSDGGTTYPIDYSHANAIWVDDALQVTLSLRHLSAIASIRGDPSAADFGAIDWRMSGDPDGAFGTDFALHGNGFVPADFEQQHNVHWLPDGHLTFFDNRLALDEPSRIVELEVDPASLEAKFVGAWELPVHCDFQGGAWRTPTGNALATCAPLREGFEFDPTNGKVAWHGAASCGDGFGSYVPRFVPLDW